MRVVLCMQKRLRGAAARFGKSVAPPGSTAQQYMV
jgi:hypothetical protein